LPTLRIQDSSREPRTGRKVGGFRPVASSKLRPVGLDAQHFEASIGADDREAVGLDRDDLAHLAGDAFGIARRQRLGLEDLERLAAEIGPCAGSRIAAAYQAVDLLPWAAPVDMGIVGSTTAFVGGLRLVLLDARSLTGFDKVDRLHHGVDA